MALAKRVEVVVYSLALKTKDNLLPSTHCPPPKILPSKQGWYMNMP